MCKGKCRRRVKSPLKVGDLVQIELGKDKYKNALVTKRQDDKIVFVRCVVGKESIEYKMMEKYLFTLNKTCCPIV